MRQLNYWLLSLLAVVLMANCSNEEFVTEMTDGTQPATRAVVEKTPKLTIYVETNDVNPLNMGEYTFTGTDEAVVDHVVLFASNIRGTASTVQLYHNPNQSHILANVETLVRPLQQKGIKVLLGLLGDHTGVGFTNMTESQMDSFAQQVADCVNQYGLDGVDFDDEYAECGRISGLPSPSAANYGKLIQKVRALLPGKLITAFYYSDSTSLNFDQASLDALDYMWPNFGASNAPASFANSKWARMSIQYTSGVPTDSQITRYSRNYAGYGAIMMFNVREYDASAKMNLFASNLWGKTVTWSGNSHAKNYGN